MRWIVLLGLLSASLQGARPDLLDDQFELPRGFHIYRAAGADLSGGSYDITFDGEGRLLVGDGTAIRRLKDTNGDGAFDGFEVVATGLGWRGPQGLLVYGDRLYAVGGDGIHLFEGYGSGGTLRDKGRIGGKFLTGGDHDAHTIFRGHDGYLYFMAGNGAGISGRTHITESNSPALFEREASVFRISPDGSKWECLASGGRNPPNLGMNYLGELFSFDSDMEWHVGLPWYRPTRLNHWIVGGDQGWQEVGAYPPYYIDCLPGILDVGRGSPTWGTFYEHHQFPGRFRNAYIVCDYRWKRESNDQYSTTGRLLAFFLARKGATWSSQVETLARPKPGARDRSGKLINFALVDVDVAPDGSLYVSDHNQGIWRIYFGDGTAPSGTTKRPRREATIPDLVDELIALQQPGAEWSRVREEAIRVKGGPQLQEQLQVLAANRRKPLEHRLKAIRFLFPLFAELPEPFIETLATDRAPEVRAQAAHLLAIRERTNGVRRLVRLLNDTDPFVRRCAAEGLTRIPTEEGIGPLISRLADTSRAVRYTAMMALAHHPTSRFFLKAALKKEPETRMRSLVAGWWRGEAPSEEQIQVVIDRLLREQLFQEERLDFLRVLGIFHREIRNSTNLHERVTQQLADQFPSSTRDIQWEQVRLIGLFGATNAFSKLLHALEGETDEVTQFHMAQSLSRLPGGWTDAEERRVFNWIAKTQRGWFAEFSGKGVEFPQFWMTVLSDFAGRHRAIVLENFAQVDLRSLLGTVTIGTVAQQPDGAQRMMALYREHSETDIRNKVLTAMATLRGGEISSFCRAEYEQASEAEVRGGLLKVLANQATDPGNASYLFSGLAHERTEVVQACATALRRTKPNLNEAQATSIINRMRENNGLSKILDPLLIELSGEKLPPLEQRLTDAGRGVRVKLWESWYTKAFGRTFPAPTGTRQKTDVELMDFVLSERAKGGDRIAGGKLYETLQCNTCHGGGTTPGREGRIFGPDLAGVTRRLSPKEFAESLIYPSKQVAERYKAYEITLKDETTTTGFITEQNDSMVTVADRDQVRRFPRSEIQAIRPQSISLMPDHLLNGLDWNQIRDLVAFLDDGSAKPQSSK